MGDFERTPRGSDDFLVERQPHRHGDRGIEIGGEDTFILDGSSFFVSLSVNLPSLDSPSRQES